MSHVISGDNEKLVGMIGNPYGDNISNKDNAEAICKAVNNTYGKGIDPEKIDKVLELLNEITEGKGAYSPDNYEHARNTIRDMKLLAKEALDSIKLTEEKKQWTQ